MPILFSLLYPPSSVYIKAPKNPFHNKHCSAGSGIDLFTLLTWLRVEYHIFSFLSGNALVGVCLLSLLMTNDSIFLVFDIKQILKRQTGRKELSQWTPGISAHIYTYKCSGA